MFGSRRREEELASQLVEARAELARRDEEPLTRRIGENVVVHLGSRQSVVGILSEVYPTSLTLRAARLLVEGVGAVSMDGDEHIVPRDKVTIVNVGVVIDDSRLAS